MRSSLRHFVHWRPQIYKYTLRFITQSSLTKVDLGQYDNCTLMDMLIDPTTDPGIKPYVYKESYYRIPTMSPSYLLQLFRIFVDSKVPRNICGKVAQAIVQKISSFSPEERIEVLNIIFDSSSQIVGYGNVVKFILREINPQRISPVFLLNMWAKSTDRQASIHPFKLMYELLNFTVSKLHELTDAQLLKILFYLRSVKIIEPKNISAMHSNIMTHRGDRHDVMAGLLLFLMCSLRYDKDIINSYLKILYRSIQEENISPASITLASVMSKQCFIYPKLYEDLEPFVTNFYQDNTLHRTCAYSYLYASIIADYFPKKFIQLYFTPEKLAAIKRDVECSPFLTSGVEVCTVVDYARVKGVDLGLSNEVLGFIEKLAYTFCLKAWEFHCNELNPWENRAIALVAEKFPLYVSWPTRAGYFMDCCIFLDDDCNPITLDSSASVLKQRDGTKSSTFDKSGLENKPDPSRVNFDLIWDLMNNEDILKRIPNKIVIEFNGPHHFLRPTYFEGPILNHYRVEGATMLRRKYLQASGWEYIGIPFFQFEQRYSSSSLCDFILRLAKHAIKYKNNS
ncbi:hypothetical protein LOD99_2494 [Oopsacas minuta]|uniref:RAP domain-containing protein n=1 Tax=Oopsacas minuta TaxID=111878 RepID=A0AAV7K244_9METZ|nr:hypothetical protein LOD99_2494 [Oopsacas minuta]